jgi:hypothetical protein
MAILFVAIPLIGLLTKKSWFFYYTYIIVPIALVVIICGSWFLSLFGDQAYSLLNIAIGLWPLLVYFAVIVILTVILQRRQKLLVSNSL